MIQFAHVAPEHHGSQLNVNILSKLPGKFKCMPAPDFPETPGWPAQQ